MANTSDSTAPSNRLGSYARDFVEEAKMWSLKASGSNGDGTTPSDSEASGSSESSGSSGPGRIDVSSLVFSRSDVILLGEWTGLQSGWACGVLN